MGRTWGTKRIAEAGSGRVRVCNGCAVTILSGVILRGPSKSSIFPSWRYFLWSGFLFFVSSLITASFVPFSWGSKISAQSLLRGGDSQSSSWRCFLPRLQTTITGEGAMPPSGLFSFRDGERSGGRFLYRGSIFIAIIWSPAPCVGYIPVDQSCCDS